MVAEPISGSTKMSKIFGLSLHPLQNFELVSSETLARLHKSAGSPAPSLITFPMSTSQYGSSCLDPVIKKDPWALGTGRSSAYVAHALVVLLRRK